MTPTRIEGIVNYLVELYSKRRAEKSLPAPLIITGEAGTGKSWILSRLRESLLSADSAYLVPIFVPLLLNAGQLVPSILRELENAKFRHARKFPFEAGVTEHEKRFVIFIENIDRLFNIGGRERAFLMPTRSKGVGAAQLAQIKHASELRSFLIENNSKVTVVATSSEDTLFLEDSEQPFFQFFNIINLKSLSDEESRDYFFSGMELEGFGHIVTSLLTSISRNWPMTLSDGKISYLNLLRGTIRDLEKEQFHPRPSAGDLLERFLRSYFHKLAPYVDLVLERLSYQEKYIVDNATALPDGFYHKDVDGLDSNIHYVLGNLRAKGLLLANGKGHETRYTFKSLALKSFLRLYKKFDIPKVIKTTESANR